MARGQSSFSRSNFHTRFLDFVDVHNSQKEKLGEKIRCSKLATAKVLLYAYYNRSFSTEIKYWNEKNPAFLPALSFNNVETIERLGLESKSTAWRAIEFLCKLDLGENRGIFMKKKFCGFYQDYLLHFNPYIITGQFVENWGKSSEKSWMPPKLSTTYPQVPVYSSSSQTKPSNFTKSKPAQNALNNPLIAKRNLPSIAGTDININNTTTNECGKVESGSIEQEQQTGTEVGSIALNPLFALYLAQRGINIPTQMPAENNTQDGAANGNSKREKYFNTTSTTTKAMAIVEVEKNPKNDLVEHSRLLTIELLKFSMPLLFPNFVFKKKGQKQELAKLVWQSWFCNDVNNSKCTVQYLDKHFENLKDCIVLALQEVENKKGAYIVGNPMLFFDKNYKFGLKRTTENWKKRHFNRDNAILLKAKRSVSSGKVPKNIKHLTSVMDLIAYWRQHFERVCYQPEIIKRVFNQFLCDPKNLPKNGTKF